MPLAINTHDVIRDLDALHRAALSHNNVVSVVGISAI